MNLKALGCVALFWSLCFIFIGGLAAILFLAHHVWGNVGMGICCVCLAIAPLVGGISKQVYDEYK